MFNDNFLAIFVQDFRAGLTKTPNQKVSIIFKAEMLHVLEMQNWICDSLMKKYGKQNSTQPNNNPPDKSSVTDSILHF